MEVRGWASLGGHGSAGHSLYRVVGMSFRCWGFARLGLGSDDKPASSLAGWL